MNFTMGELVSPWIARGMKVGDVMDMVGEIADEVSLADLLVIDVEVHFDLGIVDLLNDIEGLLTPNEIVARVIDQFIEGFDDEVNPRACEDVARGLEPFDETMALSLSRHLGTRIADLGNEGGAAELLCGLHGLGEALQVVLSSGGIHQADKLGATRGKGEIEFLLGRFNGLEIPVPPSPELEGTDARFLDEREGFARGEIGQDGIDTN